MAQTLSSPMLPSLALSMSMTPVARSTTLTATPPTM